MCGILVLCYVAPHNSSPNPIFGSLIMWLEHETPDTTRALNLSVGLASPLWSTFAAAAGAGMAWWYWSQWAKHAIAEAPVLEAGEGMVAVETVTAETLADELSVDEPGVEAVDVAASELAPAANDAVAAPAEVEPLETVVETVIDPVIEAPVAVIEPAVDLAPEPKPILKVAAPKTAAPKSTAQRASAPRKASAPRRKKSEV
jgi:hypothetical protein